MTSPTSKRGGASGRKQKVELNGPCRIKTYLLESRLNEGIALKTHSAQLCRVRDRIVWPGKAGLYGTWQKELDQGEALGQWLGLDQIPFG